MRSRKRGREGTREGEGEGEGECTIEVSPVVVSDRMENTREIHEETSNLIEGRSQSNERNCPFSQPFLSKSWGKVK